MPYKLNARLLVIPDTMMSKFTYFFDKVSNLFTQPRDPTIASRERRGAMEIIPEFEVNSTLSNETSFEYYEKQYFINKTRKILEEYLGYFRYLERLKKENSSASGSSKNLSSSDNTAEPVRPSALPQVGETTTDKGRTDPILEEKLRELHTLDLNQLMEIFENAKQTQKSNLEDISIASVCCHYG